MIIRALFLLVAFVIGSGSAAYADGKHGNPAPNDWEWPNEMEIKMEDTSGNFHYRRASFKNGDILLEAEREEKGKMVSSHLLLVKPLQIQFTEGDTEDAQAVVIPALTIGFLKKAFPSGPDSVPAGHCLKTLETNGNQLSLSMDRINEHRIGFSIAAPGAPKALFAGFWDSQMPDPLPDSFSLKGWNNPRLVVATLGEARSLRPEYTGYASGRGYTITPLDDNGEINSDAFSVSNLGMIAGHVSSGAAVWNSGKVRLLETPDKKLASARAINNAGDVAGIVYPEGKEWGKPYNAVFWKSGKIQELESLGGRSSQPYAINNVGEIVGTAQTAAKQWHAVIWRNGKVEDLAPQSGNGSSALAINNAGDIAGSVSDVAVVWKSGSMEKLGTASSCAYGINDTGQVVGSYSANGTEHAAVWNRGKIQDLDPRGEFSKAKGINNSGVVVGNANIGTDGENHAFVWNDGVAMDLDTLDGHKGWKLRDAVAINDKGEIVVIGTNAKAQTKVFLLIPAPDTQRHTAVSALP